MYVGEALITSNIIGTSCDSNGLLTLTLPSQLNCACAQSSVRNPLDDADEVVGHDNVPPFELAEGEAGRNPILVSRHQLNGERSAFDLFSAGKGSHERTSSSGKSCFPGRQRRAEGVCHGLDHHRQLRLHEGVHLLQVELAVLLVVLGEYQGDVLEPG